MADPQVIFAVEAIPDEALVFMRAHKTRIKNGLPTPSAFAPKGNGRLSVEWEKYATPEQTRLRGKVPEDNAVVQMVTGQIRGIREDLDVEHVPLETNQAHSEINIPLDHVEQTQVRLLLNRIATVIIPLA